MGKISYISYFKKKYKQWRLPNKWAFKELDVGTIDWCYYIFRYFFIDKKDNDIEKLDDTIYKYRNKIVKK